MASATCFKRSARLRRSCAFSLLCFAASALAGNTPPDRCIVADRAIGCVDQNSIVELTTPRKNVERVREIVQKKLASGQCRQFDYGERVVFVDSTGGERTAVHRAGERTVYWLPASWTQPADQCEANESSATLLAKIGMPNRRSPVSVSSEAPPLRDSPAYEGATDSSDVDADARADLAEDPERRPTRGLADRWGRQNDSPERDATRDDADRDYRYRGSHRFYRYGSDSEDDRVTAAHSIRHRIDPEAAYEQTDGAPPPQHAPLRSSTYARSRQSRHAPDACTSGVILTDSDVDPCEELR